VILNYLFLSLDKYCCSLDCSFQTKTPKRVKFLFPVGKEYDQLKTIELKEEERIFYSNLKDCLRAEEALPNCDDDSDKTFESSEKLKCNANHHHQKDESVSTISEETEIKVAIKNNEKLDKNETSDNKDAHNDSVESGIDLCHDDLVLNENMPKKIDINFRVSYSNSNNSKCSFCGSRITKVIGFYLKIFTLNNQLYI
jgi:hypothetical protein